MAQPDPTPKADGFKFRTTLVRVMVSQVVALLLLWWLQAHYPG